MEEPRTGIFIDKKSGKEFRKIKYFDHEVIQDVETGWINAGKFVMDLYKSGQIKKRFNYFKETSDYQQLLQHHIGSAGKPADLKDIEKQVFREYSVNYGNEVKGTYCCFEDFQIIALWADKTHLYAILDLLKTINDYANSIDRSAYDVVNAINEQLKTEIKELKEQHDKDVMQINDLNDKITDLTTPINKLNKSTIYASPVGKDYFQLRFSTVTPSKSVNMIKSVQLTNAKDVKEQTMEKLMKEQLVEKKDHKQVINTDHLDHAFEIINSVKLNKDEVITFAQRNVYIDAEIDKLKQRPQTKQRNGKIFELEQIKLTKDLIPWALVPQSTRNKYNEIKKDTGIDAVKLEDGNITHIFQYKKHSGEQLTKNELTNFISKFKSIPKTLVTKDCKIGKKLMKTLIDMGIEVSII